MHRAASLVVLLALLFIAPECCAFEARFYSSKPSSGDQKKFYAIFDVVDHADRNLAVEELDRIDIGIGPVDGVKRSPIYFNRQELKGFLQKERHRGTLTVFLDKALMRKEKDRMPFLLKELNGFLDDTGYRRILILGGSPEGVHVLSDRRFSRRKPTDKPATAR